MSGMTIILLMLSLLTIPVSPEAQDSIELSIQPSSAPTSFATASSRPSFQQSQSPSTPPSKSLVSTATKKPTDYGSFDPFFSCCDEDPDFFVEIWEYDQNCKRTAVKVTCGDSRITCIEPLIYGNLGEVNDYCCKCKVECASSGQCQSDTTPPPDYSSDCDVTNDYVHEYDDDTGNGGLPTIALVVCVLIGLAICAKIVIASK